MSHSGLRVPSAASRLVSAAKASGWAYKASWGKDREGLPLHRVYLARKATELQSYAHAVLVWHLDTIRGSLVITNAVIRTEPGGPWMEIRNMRVLTDFISSGGPSRQGEKLRA